MSRYIELVSTSNFSFLRGGSHPEELAVTAGMVGLDGFGHLRGRVIARELPDNELFDLVGERGHGFILLVACVLHRLHAQPMFRMLGMLGMHASLIPCVSGVRCERVGLFRA